MERPTSMGSALVISKKEEESNIQVVIRCRGRRLQEAKERVIVACEKQKIKVSSSSIPEQSQSDKVRQYTFDKVFGSEVSQEEVFSGVVCPILDEVLQGYNCTIFAYGQTGTGKTYTMIGDLTSWDFQKSPQIIPSTVGIIPRALSQLFAILSKNAQEFSIKLSFLEIYNEQLRDLLTNQNEEKLKLFDDGKKGTYVKGIEEFIVSSLKDGVEKLLEGSLRREVAATSCNDKSSRSHAIFTLTVHIRQPSPNGEDLITIGKLNLVDLAGSENINRSGTTNSRAREAGEINKSLLTLGRVINSLVEKSPHVPYRESKLTRILQDSLGGRTKTSIIATINPLHSSREETLSTLEYAKRAKNIRNRPEANQRMSKQLLINEYVSTIEELKEELRMAREKHGVFLKEDRYKQLLLLESSRNAELEYYSEKENELLTRATKSQQELENIKTIFSQQLQQWQMSVKDTLIGIQRAVIQQSSKYKQSLGQIREVYESALQQQSERTMQKLQEMEAELESLFKQQLQQRQYFQESTKQKTNQNLQNQRDFLTTLRDSWNPYLENLTKEMSGAMSHINEHISPRTRETCHYFEQSLGLFSQLRPTVQQKNLQSIEQAQVLLLQIKQNLEKFQLGWQEKALEMKGQQGQSKRKLQSVDDEIRKAVQIPWEQIYPLNLEEEEQKQQLVIRPFMAENESSKSLAQLQSFSEELAQSVMESLAKSKEKVLEYLELPLPVSQSAATEEDKENLNQDGSRKRPRLALVDKEEVVEEEEERGGEVGETVVKTAAVIL